MINLWRISLLTFSSFFYSPGRSSSETWVIIFCKREWCLIASYLLLGLEGNLYFCDKKSELIANLWRETIVQQIHLIIAQKLSKLQLGDRVYQLSSRLIVTAISCSKRLLLLISYPIWILFQFPVSFPLFTSILLHSPQ